MKTIEDNSDLRKFYGKLVAISEPNHTFQDTLSDKVFRLPETPNLYYAFIRETHTSYPNGSGWVSTEKIIDIHLVLPHDSTNENEILALDNLKNKKLRLVTPEEQGKIELAITNRKAICTGYEQEKRSTKLSKSASRLEVSIPPTGMRVLEFESLQNDFREAGTKRSF